jgi:phospholipid/cholesterol/gamma-HCH transport system permease protein
MPAPLPVGGLGRKFRAGRGLGGESDFRAEAQRREEAAPGRRRLSDPSARSGARDPRDGRLRWGRYGFAPLRLRAKIRLGSQCFELFTAAHALAGAGFFPHDPRLMRDGADFTTEEEGGATTIALSGPLTVATSGALDRRLRALDQAVAKVDLSSVSDIDTVGAWITWRLARDHEAEIVGASDQAERLIAAVRESQGDASIRPPRVDILRRVPEAVGELVVGWGQGTVGVVGFLGALMVSSWHTIRNPAKLRVKALVRQIELVGVSALGIVGLMCFLVGIVIAQQGAVQLQQFGAEFYTINLTGRLAMRELGVLMTAIMVAGRSGSAFAAQLGTMKLTEEVDAMRTIGVSPVEALIIPRVLAAVLMMPLLGFYAAVMAIIGGAVLANFALEIPFGTFLLRIKEVVPMHDVWVGLIKAPFFGLIIALAGCYQGMQVEANAEEVGNRTTMAVVQAIFMVIVLDAFFAIFFSNVGWG